MKKAIVLLSGGLDSAVVLGIAKHLDRDCLALSFDYGQRHKVELEAAKKIAAHYTTPHKLIVIDTKAFGNSSLVSDIHVPKDRKAEDRQKGTPNTYVPARNSLFLAFAMAQAELWQAEEIYIGANALDNAYPDCRQGFIEAFQGLLNIATAQALAGNAPKLVAPLIAWNKAQIIAEGKKLNVPLEKTFSCYDPTRQGTPCNRCDACVLRAEGFKDCVL